MLQVLAAWRSSRRSRPSSTFRKKSAKRCAFGRRRAYSKRPSRSQRSMGDSSSTRGRRRPTGCRTTGTCSRASSKISFLATRRCAAGACRAKRAGTRTACRSRSRSRRSSASTARRRSRRTASSRSSSECIESVFRYTNEWEELTERVAFWVDLDDAYVTYHRTYVESVWWALRRAVQQGTPLPGAQGRLVVGARRNGAQLRRGRARVQHRRRSERVRRVPACRSGAGPARRRRRSLLVWTTTPWTLPSNMYAAVHPTFDYVDRPHRRSKALRGRRRAWWRRSPRSSAS